MYKRYLEYDTRKARLNVLPKDWIKHKEYFLGFTDREIILFRLQHGLSLGEAVHDLGYTANQYREIYGLDTDRNDFWDVNNFNNITGEDIRKLIEPVI